MRRNICQSLAPAAHTRLDDLLARKNDRQIAAAEEAELDTLRQEYEAAGKVPLYERLKIFRTGAEPKNLLTYAELSARFGVPVWRVGELVRDELAAVMRRLDREVERERADQEDRGVPGPSGPPGVHLDER